MLLSELGAGLHATVSAVVPRGDHDVIATRLGELGFVPGEPIKLVTRGPLGREPLLVQIGFTRFALRRLEADRIVVEPAASQA
ncbi:FeoA family protein [soil metagenome]